MHVAYRAGHLVQLQKAKGAARIREMKKNVKNEKVSRITYCKTVVISYVGEKKSESALCYINGGR